MGKVNGSKLIFKMDHIIQAIKLTQSFCGNFLKFGFPKMDNSFYMYLKIRYGTMIYIMFNGYNSK